MNKPSRDVYTILNKHSFLVCLHHQTDDLPIGIGASSHPGKPSSRDSLECFGSKRIECVYIARDVSLLGFLRHGPGGLLLRPAALPAGTATAILFFLLPVHSGASGPRPAAGSRDGNDRCSASEEPDLLPHEDPVGREQEREQHEPQVAFRLQASGWKEQNGGLCGHSRLMQSKSFLSICSTIFVLKFSPKQPRALTHPHACTHALPNESPQEKNKTNNSRVIIIIVGFTRLPSCMAIN